METKQVIDAINAEWAQFKDVLKGEVKTQIDAYGTALGDSNAKLDLMEKAIVKLEAKLSRPPQEIKGLVPDELASSPAQRKAWDQAMRRGPDALDAKTRALFEEVKSMIVTDDTQGGFGAPAEFSAEIVKGVTDISPMRALVSVRNTGMRSVRVMKRTGTFAAQWIGGSGTRTRTETTGLAYGMEEIPTHELYAMVDVAVQDLEDTQFNLEGELSSEFTDQFALAEGTAIIDGTANGQPEGIMTNAAVAQAVTGHATLLTYDGLVDVSHNGKEQYLANSRFLFRLTTLGALRKILDGNGDPVWAPMAVGAPATILGFPYTVVVGMPAIAADAYPVVFGDFGRAYRLVDRVALAIDRDPFTQKSVGAVRFWARKRLGGQVVLAEALRKLKVSAA